MPRDVNLFVAAHPDDETIGAAVAVCEMPISYVAHVTDGAPRDMTDARRLGLLSRGRYALQRRQEARRALRLAGLRPTRLHNLGGVDRESWYHLPALVRRLVLLLRRLKPTAVWTHPYEGGHPDHDATAFIVHAARALLGPQQPRFVLMEFASYHAGLRGQMVRGSFLQPNAASDGDAPVLLRSLGQGERARKRAMMGCYVTQRQVLEMFPLDRECFREAPRYQFLRAPHPGPLYYEQQPWGTAGHDWRRKVQQAAVALGLDPHTAL